VIPGVSLSGWVNRLLRRIGRGEPLYTVEGRAVRGGRRCDRADHDQFDAWLRSSLPHAFELDFIDPSPLETWITENTSGLYWFSFSPLFLHGEVMFEKEDDAVMFKVFFGGERVRQLPHA
jgi:hypothetical protein